MPLRILRSLLAVIVWPYTALVLRAADGPLVYFGTFTEKTSEGLYVSRFDPATGTLGPVTLVAKIANPSFVILHPSLPLLYAISEQKNADGNLIGNLESFAIDRVTGRLAPLKSQPSGEEPLCYVSVGKTGGTVLGANYRKGYVVSFPLLADGSLGARVSCIQHSGSSLDKERQTGPHAHCIDLDRANRFALVADLGLDQVFTYAVDSTQSTLTTLPAPYHTKPGAGPRHLAFDASGRHIYLVNEIDSTLTLANYAPETGSLTEQQTLSLLPPDFNGTNTAAEVVIHPSGKFLYASNRGYDSLELFAIAPDTGRLTYVATMREGVKHPRHFAIDPAGHWLLCANRDADSVTIYRIDLVTGHLTKTNNTAKISMPSCIQFVVP